VCSGIIDAVHTPEMTRMLGQPPMQKPFAAQTVVENILRGIFAALSTSRSSECQFSTRKYFCSAWMLKPEAQNMSYVFEHNNISDGQLLGARVNMATQQDNQVYLPSYPHRDICFQYFDECGDYLRVFDKASYQPERCNQVLENGVESFPTGSQVVLHLEMALSNSTNYSTMINFITSPNRLLNVVDKSDYQTPCPQGFVVPDNKRDPDNDWIDGTVCATACRYRTGFIITFHIIL
jgi:hypothetical protein